VTERPDVVVVGGGAAGAVVASRLSADPSVRVLLLEAGPAPDRLGAFPARLLDAGTVQGADPDHPENWAFPAMLTPDRPYSIARGRILGGSTTINGGYFLRARHSDLERWARRGGAAWSPDRMLELYRRSETDLDFGESSIHGGSGPILVKRPPLDDAISAAFVAAANADGWASLADAAAENPPGVGAVPQNVAHGIRQNSALAYLLPVLHRPNLAVRGDIRVLRVLASAGRVTGVEVEREGVVETIASGLVVLCAGAFSSPHLLQVSGIGPADRLREAGVEVLLDAPGVGASFSDHPQIAVSWLPRPGAVDLDLPRIMAARLALRSSDESEQDLELLPMLKPTTALLGHAVSEHDGVDVLVSLLRARSRGSIALSSPDVRVAPDIRYHYLVDEDDRRRLRLGVRLAARLLGSAEFAPLTAGFADGLEPALATDSGLDEWIGRRIGTSVHASGSAPMGPATDTFAVVDPSGCVHGITGLRIADTSILPDAPTGGPSATAVLLGELVSDAIRTGP
jgi:predicted dehydrogenase (TIGR03970 family)